MTLERLHAELDEITDDKTLAVVLITVSAEEIRARSFGDRDLVQSALLDLIDDLESDRPIRESYAH